MGYFNQIFVEYINELSIGQSTPNPDAQCSAKISFGKLQKYAIDECECDYVATGHYAAIRWDNQLRIPFLCQSKERCYDQSYFLSRIPFEALLCGRHLFPIGNWYTQKDEQIRRIARECIASNERISSKPSSTGLCYVQSSNAFASFLHDFIDYNYGQIIDCFGRIIGQHKGLSFYTLGQRVKFDKDLFNNLCFLF